MYIYIWLILWFVFFHYLVQFVIDFNITGTICLNNDYKYELYHKLLNNDYNNNNIKLVHLIKQKKNCHIKNINNKYNCINEEIDTLKNIHICKGFYVLI